MNSRFRLLAGLACSVLMFAAAACQALPFGRAAATAVAQPTAAVSNAISGSDSVVWARIPFCGCLDGTSTDNVSAALKRAQLTGKIELLNPTNGWMYFVVAFDPQAASPAQIGAAIVDGGGEVMAGPP